MMSPRDITELEQAARMIIKVIERHRYYEEEAQERRKNFRLITNIPRNGEQKEPE